MTPPYLEKGSGAAARGKSEELILEHLGMQGVNVPAFDLRPWRLKSRLTSQLRRTLVASHLHSGPKVTPYTAQLGWLPVFQRSPGVKNQGGESQV